MGFMGIEDIKEEDFMALDRLFHEFIPDHDSIYLFGAGKIGIAYFHFLSNMGIIVNGFLVSDKEKNHKEIENIPVYELTDFKNQQYQRNSSGVLLTCDNKYYDEVIPNLLFLGEDLMFLGKSRYILLRHEMDIQYCSFHIVDHCNLACSSCDAAAPIAENFFIDFDTFEKNLYLFKRVVNRHIKPRLTITGGEALLHPQCMSFLRKTRVEFPENEIHLLTNGLLLGEKDDDFWKQLSTLGITINMTVYPIRYRKLDYAKFMADKYNVKMLIGFGSGNKASCYLPLNQEPANSIYDQALCPLFNYPRVINGKLMPCCLMPEIKHLNLRFNTNIVIDDDDLLDLEKVTDYQDVKNFMRRLLKTCQYCNLRKREVRNGWSSSSKEMNEWIIG